MKKIFWFIVVTTILAGCASNPAPEQTPAVNSDGSISIRFGGGDGSSIKNAITLIGANTEMAGIGGEALWAKQFLPGWKKSGQELIANGKKYYDGITYQAADGKTRTVYFDISAFFGKF